MKRRAKWSAGRQARIIDLRAHMAREKPDIRRSRKPKMQTGEHGGTRTHNHRLKRAMLYH
jgi:hypothetical protein